MSEVSLVIPTDIIKTVYSGASSAAMGLKNIMMIVEDDKLIVKHVNDGRSAMMKFVSRELLSGLSSAKLPIDVTDLKTIVNLAKDESNVTFLIGDGTTVCKVGKTKKQFAQPETDKLPDKDPNFEVTTKLEFNDSQANDVISTFSDLKEQGDFKVISTAEKVVFKVEESNRSTEIEFTPVDLMTFSAADAMAGYDMSMAISLFKIKQKGVNLLIEFGRDVPIRSMQTTNSGTLSIVLAPKIY